MKTLPTISLTHDWAYRQTADTDVDYRAAEPDVDTWERLTSLTEMELALSGDKTVWLRKDFWLHPLDVCVRYHLTIELPSLPLDVYVNGHVAGSCAASSEVDVTDYVTLDRNRLALKVVTVGSGSLLLKRIVLRAVPCEADH